MGGMEVERDAYAMQRGSAGPQGYASAGPGMLSVATMHRLRQPTPVN
jgi:hypothetical protein